MKDTLFKRGVSIALIVIIVHSLGYFYYRSTRYSYIEGMEGKKPEKAIEYLDMAIKKMKEIDGEKSNQSDEQQRAIGAIQGARMRVKKFIDERTKLDMDAEEKTNEAEDDIELDRDQKN